MSFSGDSYGWNFQKFDILLFFMVKLLFILNIDAQMLKKFSVDNSSRKTAVSFTAARLICLGDYKDERH